MIGPFDESEIAVGDLETSLQPNPPLQATLGREVPNMVDENRLAIKVASAMSEPGASARVVRSALPSEEGDSMKDIQTHLEKLRSEAAECLVASNLTTDPEKRQLFASVVEQTPKLASAVQNEVAVESANVVRAAEAAFVDQKQAIRYRQILPWFVVVILLAAAGAFAWSRVEKDASVTTLEAKAGAPQEGTKQAIAKFLSAEEEKRKVLSEQLGALAARVDNLEKARAEIVEATTKRETIGQSRRRK